MHLDIIKNQLQTSETSAIPMWLKRVRPDILSWLIDQTNQYPVKNVMERIYIMLNGIPPKCTDGNYKKFNTFEKGYRDCCHLGNKCLDVSLNRQKNQKLTLIKRYGVDNVMDVPGVKDKIKKTNIQKYGVEHHSQNAQIKIKSKTTRSQQSTASKLAQQEKSKQTSLAKYGVEHHMMLKDQQEKVKKTTYLTTGKYYALQAEEFLQKMKETRKARHDQTAINKKTKQTLLSRYGVDAASRINLSEKAANILYDKDSFCDFVKNKSRGDVVQELDIAFHTLYLYAKKYEAVDLFARPLISEPEKEIADWLSTLGINFAVRDRTVIKPKELDFYLPDHKLAIEFCGLYWHSEISADKNRQYHATKHSLCEAQGIKLVTIFEDEWKNKKQQVKSILQNILIDSDRLYARQCEIQEVTLDNIKHFVDDIHVQGSCPALINLALYHQGNIVSVMTFGKPRYNKKYQWELIRYCSSKKIVGGAKKLFNFFVKNYNPESIVSYSDNRYFDGSVYNTLGFTKKNTTIGYFYTDYNNRYDRQQFQKHRLVEDGADPALTEFQIMQQRGYDRIWDCGQVMWEYIRQKHNEINNLNELQKEIHQ